MFSPYAPVNGQPGQTVQGADESRTQRIPGRAGSEPDVSTERVHPAGTEAETSPAPPESSGQPGLASGERPWMPVSSLPPDPWWVHLRRFAVLGLAGIVGVAGVVTIGDTVLRWVRPAPPPAAPPAVSDTQLAGAASVAATDYLSWDSDNRSARQSALSHETVPGFRDGWDGTGRQWADSPAAVDVRRGAADTAVVTVRVRVTPFTSAPTTPSAPADGGAAASAPNLTASGATAAAPRWLNMAIPMTTAGGHPAVSAQPALIGSPPERVEPPAVPGISLGDDQLAAATRETTSRLLGAYGSGDLSYARASGTTFTGLDGAARLGQVQQWRVAPSEPGADPAQRRGDATVTWDLAGGGHLTCPYLVDLRQNDGRWYLAGISAETEDIAP